MLRKSLLVFAIVLLLVGGLPVFAQDVTAIAHYEQGIMDAQNGDLVSAVEEFSDALKLDPNYIDAYIARGYTYSGMGEYELALADYTRAIELDPEYAFGYINRADTYRLMEDYTAAMADYDRAVELAPDVAFVFYSRGFAYQWQGEFASAVEDYTRAIELEPEYAEAYFQRGESLYWLSDYEAALGDLNAALELNPADLNIYYTRGNVYLEQGEYDSAVADYTHVIENVPDYPWTYQRRGIAYVYLENFTAARADLDRAVEMLPDEPAFYAARAFLFYEQENFEAALADYQTVARLAGDAVDPGTLDLIAELEARLGGTSTTASAGGALAAPFRVAPLFAPEPLPFGDPQAAYDEGIALLQSGEYEQAVDSFSQAIELDPDFADAYYIRARLSAFLEDYEVAVADFTRVIELAPLFPDVYFERGRVYYLQGEVALAQADFAQYTRLAGADAPQENLDYIADIQADQALISGPTPTTAQGYYDRAQAYNRASDSEQAVADLTEAVELDPDFGDAYLLRSWINLDLEDNDQALADYQRAAELDITDSGYFLAWGAYFTEQGDAENAGHAFYRWLTLNEQRTFDQDALTPGESFTVEMQEGALFNVPFEAEAGQVVSITANDADGSGVDPLIVILDADGNALVGDDDSGGGLDSLISDFELPADGTYTLVIGHAGGGSVGAVEVTLNIGS